VLLYHLNLFFYCDYFYQSSGTRYPSHGAASNNDYQSGTFAMVLLYPSTHSYWNYGASLSFK